MVAKGSDKNVNIGNKQSHWIKENENVQTGGQQARGLGRQVQEKTKVKSQSRAKQSLSVSFDTDIRQGSGTF